MDRKLLDRIIVRSNARMSMVLEWYNKNKDWLNEKEFHAPMDAGVVELQEEAIEFTFESKYDLVEIAIYPAYKPNLPAIVTFDYDPKTWRTSNYRFASHLPKERVEIMRMIMLEDKTDMKEALKYHILMLFMAYYREIVVVEEKGTRTKHEAKKLRKDVSKPLPLIRKQYTIDGFDSNDLDKFRDKRKYTKPDHEVNVRGYERHYKSGKVVWICPQVRYKGKGRKKSEYEL